MTEPTKEAAEIESLKQERDAALAANEILHGRVKGALELAAELVGQRDEFIKMKQTYDGVVAELDRTAKDARDWEKDARMTTAQLHQVKVANQSLRQELEDEKKMRAIAQNRYAPMLKENEHHRRERDVLETQLMLLRDKALSYVAMLPSFSSDPAEEAAMRSDIQRELFAMATPRKS